MRRQAGSENPGGTLSGIRALCAPVVPRRSPLQMAVRDDEAKARKQVAPDENGKQF